MILCKHPSTDKALELNRLFVEYQKLFGEMQKLGKEILQQLADNSQASCGDSRPRLSGGRSPPSFLPILSLRKIMSTRHSIWLGESQGKSVHIYWELAEREIGDGGTMRTPIYIAADAGNAGQEVAVRLPKEIGMRLLMVLAPNWTEEIGQVL